MLREAVIVVLTAASMGVIYYGGYDHARSDCQARIERVARLAAEATVARMQAEAGRTSLAAEDHRLKEVAIETHTKWLVKEIPIYVSAETDRRYPMPVGLIRVHDAAAAGIDPPPAGELDDAASPVVASQLGGAIALNYGSCHETAQRLSDLQAFIRGQEGY